MDVAAVLARVEAGKRPPLEALHEDTPKEIQMLIERCWAAEQGGSLGDVAVD